MLLLDWMAPPYTWEHAIPIWSADNLDHIKDMVMLTCKKMYAGGYRMTQGVGMWRTDNYDTIKPLKEELEHLAKERGWV